MKYYPTYTTLLPQNYPILNHSPNTTPFFRHYALTFLQNFKNVKNVKSKS